MRVIHFDRHEDLQREFDALLEDYTALIFKVSALESSNRALLATVKELQLAFKPSRRPAVVRRIPSTEVH